MHFWRFLLSIIGMVFLAGCCDKAKKQELIIINVLNKELYDDCHIKGSINIPFEKFAIESEKLNKNADIVVYCSNYQCTASGYAAELLLQKGFKKVAAYEAGMAEWYQRGLPIEGACEKAYLKQQSEKISDEHQMPIITTEELKNKIKSVLAVNISS